MQRDTDPPRVFSTVTARAVSYNMDFVEYLIGQEVTRRAAAGYAAMTLDELADFKRQLIALAIIQQNPEAAIALRSTRTPTTVAVPTIRQQLNG